jgi:hypothetical protein
MIKYIFIIIIFILCIKILLQNEDFTNNKINNISDMNFCMHENSIQMSMSSKYNENACLAKINGKDINGATYRNDTKECILYFFAEKGKININCKSKIYI